MDVDARALIATLGLKEHPEGGFFLETLRSQLDVGGRSASTAIYFLLPAGAFSAWHRVRSDEVWHWYDGDPLELQVIDLQGQARRHVLGRGLDRGERPQTVVPAGHLQAARSLGERYALCGCTVAPGFDFVDFELPSREALLAELPHLRDLIVAYTISGR